MRANKAIIKQLTKVTLLGTIVYQLTPAEAGILSCTSGACSILQNLVDLDNTNNKTKQYQKKLNRI